MPKAIEMNSYNPQQENIFLFDTNILIDLFYPMNIGKDTSAITNLYQKILKANSKIIITSVQVSEFINRCIRFQFALYKNEHEDCEDFKKDYRGTDDYNSCMQTIIDIVKNEWKGNVDYVDDKFSELSLEKIFSANFAYDFNDAIIVEIANKYNAIFITNDADFINYSFNMPVISKNRLLLCMH